MASLNTSKSGSATVTASPPGIVESVAPAAQGDTTSQQVAVDARRRSLIVGETGTQTLWGKQFFVGGNATTGVLFKNPLGSGKLMVFKNISFHNTFGGGVFGLYLNSTTTANGTALTVVGARQVGQSAPACSVFKDPTISVLGNLIYTFSDLVSGSAAGPQLNVVNIDFDYGLILEPNNTLTINNQMIFSASYMEI